MRHPFPCSYDDSISGNPDSDFCTCPAKLVYVNGFGFVTQEAVAAALVLAEQNIDGLADAAVIDRTERT